MSCNPPVLHHRQLLLAVAFPHNTWRLCRPQQAAASWCKRQDCRRQHQGGHGHNSTCRAAAPQQPEQPGIPQHPPAVFGQQPAGTQPGGPMQQYATSSSTGQEAVPTIQLPNLTPPIPPSPPPLLSWLPPQLLTHLQALLGFLKACWELLPEFVSPSFSEACRRLCLVLGASLVMVVLVSSIDSGWLYLYLLNARRVVAA